MRKVWLVRLSDRSRGAQTEPGSFIGQQSWIAVAAVRTCALGLTISLIRSIVLICLSEHQRA